MGHDPSVEKMQHYNGYEHLMLPTPYNLDQLKIEVLFMLLLLIFKFDRNRDWMIFAILQKVIDFSATLM
jgi:hypothetical protein